VDVVVACRPFGAQVIEVRFADIEGNSLGRGGREDVEPDFETELCWEEGKECEGGRGFCLGG